MSSKLTVRSAYGNCMTEVVTEMPRSCSMLIQSDVAWRSDFRAFTVPANFMALPNNNSFSVIVVLPASGCEIIAKVRLSWCCKARIQSEFVHPVEVKWSGRREYTGLGFLGKFKRHNHRIFSSQFGRIIVFANAHLDKTKRIIESERNFVAGSNLEKKL